MMRWKGESLVLIEDRLEVIIFTRNRGKILGYFGTI